MKYLVAVAILWSMGMFTYVTVNHYELLKTSSKDIRDAFCKVKYGLSINQ